MTNIHYGYVWKNYYVKERKLGLDKFVLCRHGFKNMDTGNPDCAKNESYGFACEEECRRCEDYSPMSPIEVVE